jgi:flavorubredoxin
VTIPDKTTTRHDEPRALVEGKLYALGGTVELDGRVSWVPRTASGYQPVNCYLLVEGERALLIDSGLPVHLAQITSQLEQLIGDDTIFSVYVTRAEMDCVGNVAALTATFDTEAVLTGGVYNPFDGFDQITAESRGEGDQPVLRILPGEAVELGRERQVEVLRPPLRMLTSFWAYDSATCTLFTSDVFGYGSAAAREYRPVIRAREDRSTAATVREETQAKYWWLPVVDRASLIEGLDEIFAAREIRRIAPTHGFVLEGAELVARHYALLREVLQGTGEVGQDG